MYIPGLCGNSGEMDRFVLEQSNPAINIVENGGHLEKLDEFGPFQNLCVTERDFEVFKDTTAEPCYCGQLLLLQSGKIKNSLPEGRISPIDRRLFSASTDRTFRANWASI